MIEPQAMGLAATSYGFTPDELADAARKMSTANPVEVQPLQRGGSGWDVEILLQGSYAVLLALGPNLAASAIWDGLKLLLVNFRRKHGESRPEPLVTFKINETNDGGRSVEAFVRTDDPEYLRRAMTGLTEAVSATFDRSEEEWTYVVYEEEKGGWTPAEE
ncbi:hypothetical protein GCM10020358_23640 [Amorphoplanes nipponensis]|uniref:Uncharacterized protein n=1 Tax=Actinoplanes nipponensis TaxID=135950 RepID=A0A919JHB9_9ACTN|nr:hypothetical protein [Actinoplanes nipponensis]GIE49643.1 hypothetical protein Ani05nite_31770 [Actinoplanes nipponensis]